MGYISRDLSWLAFNARVLQEAMDNQVPLVERIRFLGIYSNNLDEFYRVRIASLKRAIKIGVKNFDDYSHSLSHLSEKINEEIAEQQVLFEATYLALLAQLEKENIFQVDENHLTVEQQNLLSDYFHSQLRQNIVPVLLRKNFPFPKLKDKGIYLAVKMEFGETLQYALLQIPDTHKRFFVLPEENGVNKFILLDDIIRLNLSRIFSIFKYNTIQAFTFKFSRDAELTLEDDLNLNFRQKMEKSLKNRKKGDPIRFVYDEFMPKDLKQILLKGLNIKSQGDTVSGAKYHNFKDFMKFPDFGKQNLIYRALPPLNHPYITSDKSILKQLLKKDLLLSFPYQKFDYIIDLLREAALDPKVTKIKINLYRVAKDSKIVNALLSAVQNGKEVVAIIELQARFDEENNLYWAEKLQEEGATVLHGIPSYKIHSKLLYIERVSENNVQELAFVGTGNFNEGTALVYSDLGYFTVNKNLIDEVKKVFRFIENPLLNNLEFKYLQVSPFNNRSSVTNLIKKEIENAKLGKPASIRLKINNLVDKKLIENLVAASTAGVKITIIARGMCCLVPETKTNRKNIKIISIVDRFLEHSRMMIFENGGKPKYYITSADWMERNMDRRIEVGVPILDKEIQQQLSHFFAFQQEDTFKGRMIEKNHVNQYILPIRNIETRSQQQTYDYLRSL